MSKNYSMMSMKMCMRRMCMFCCVQTLMGFQIED